MHAKNRDLPLPEFDNPITVVEHELAAEEREKKEQERRARAVRLPIVQ